MNEYAVAIIGVVGVIVGALISGIFQAIETQNTIRSTEAQFEKQLQQNQIEFYAKIEQLRNEHREAVINRAFTHFTAERKRAYENMIAKVSFYNFLSNEIPYLINLSSPKLKHIRTKYNSYSPIQTLLSQEIHAIRFPTHLSTTLGSLRAYIDYYNACFGSESTSEDYEVLLSSIYALLSEIADRYPEELKDTLDGLRKYEQKTGDDELSYAQLTSDKE